MQLKGKIIIVLISVVLVVTLAYYAVFRFVILESFIELDKQDARENMYRCTAALDREIRLLNRFVHDWAAWDDTYKFVQGENESYRKSNLTWDVNRDQKLQLIQIYNLQGKLVGNSTYDLKTGKEITLDLSRVLDPEVFSKLIHHTDESKSIMGIIRTPYGPMMFSSNPILTSEVKGPIKGAIIMGRFINTDVITQIAEQVDVKITGIPAADALAESRVPNADVPASDIISLRKEGNDKLIATTLIRDIGGHPALYLKASLERDIMKKGITAYTYGLIFILGGGIALLFVVGGLLQFMVLKPVSKLTDNIISVGKVEATVDKSLLGRKDELGTLSREYNSMVNELVDREQNLWLKEKRLRQIIDLVPHFIFAKDEEGRYILANKALADAFGYKVQELVGRFDHELVRSHDEVSQFRSVDQEVIRSGEQSVVPEEALTDAQGNVRILQTTKIPFTFSGTSVPAVLGISVDLTEIKKAEKALRESERRMASLIDFLPDPTFAIDRDGKVIVWNRAMENLTGLKKDDILGRGDYLYSKPFYGESRPVLTDLILSPDENMSGKYDFIHKIGDKLFAETFVPELYGKRGAYIWAVATKLYDSEGNVAGAIECMRDVTERKMNEEMLKRQSAVIEQSLDGIFIADLDGIIQYVNPAMARMHGRTPEELKGKHIRVLHTESQFTEEMVPIIEEVKASGNHTGKVGHVNKDGTPFTTLMSSFALRDHKDNPRALIGIARDISDEIRMEGQLRHAQKMEVIGQLAGGVAHDLNNMLAPVLGYAEMLIQGMQEHDPYYHGLFQILTAADRARKLTRQLLAFGSKQVLDMKTVDLSEIVESYTKMIRRTIREDIQIKISNDAAISSVQVDTAQIGQIILNLALNAQDAMPSGGVITIETATVRLDQAYASKHPGIEQGEYVRLTFSDTGTGMDKETLDHIFEPFFTTKDRGKGTGLGLATVYGIVIQHKGQVIVYSEPGLGTTFKIYLPKADGEVERMPDKAHIGKGKHGKETIVVAEDDDGVRDLACEILSKHGYRVITGRNTEEFIKAIDHHNGPIHLMLTDVIMPGMNGKQLFDRVKADHPEMKVIFMSGYTDDVIAHHGILDKGVNFIQKPFSIQLLTERIRRVLDGA